MILARRAALAGGAAIVGGALAGTRPARATGRDKPLRDLAAQRGLVFGTEVVSTELRDPDYRALVAREAGAVTPGLEAKWDHVEPSPGRFDFAALDRIASFAQGNDARLRLHTLVWSMAVPPWLDWTLRHGTRVEVVAVLERHVRAVAGRYRGRVWAWDVCNELSDPLWHRGPEGLTLTPWRRALGPDLVPIAFALAREADPDAVLFVNEDGLEWRGARFDDKRATYLRLVEGWRRAGVPIGGFGLQTHLSAQYPFDEPAYRRFLATLAGFDLRLHVTELDMRDRALPADPPRRDAEAAALTRRVLDAALDERAVEAVITWGLSDRYSYQNGDPEFARDDALPNRPLPWDIDLEAKPMRDAIAGAIAAAPSRNTAAANASAAVGRRPEPVAL